MAQTPAAVLKIPTESPQPAPGKAPARRARLAKQRAGSSRTQLLASGSERAASRGGGEVIALDCGITVYPARGESGRWRAVWHEDGERQQCEAASEGKLARLAKVHWQAGDRALPAPQYSVAGESAQWVDPAEIPSHDDVAKLGQALAAGVHGDRDELMANTAAYSGLRWGELIALTIPQVDQARRVIAVDRKDVEVAGHLFVEAPKNRKHRKTIYPRRTPTGYPLAERLAARIEQVLAEQAAGASPRPEARVPGCRLARCGGQGRVDLAQPAARVLHHRAVHLEARPD